MSLTEPFPYSPQMGIMLTEKSRLPFSQESSSHYSQSKRFLVQVLLEKKPGHDGEFFCLLLSRMVASQYLTQSASG